MTTHPSASYSSHHKLIKKLINSQKIEAVRGLLKELSPVEIANSLLQLKLKHQLILLENLPKELASETLAHLQHYSPILEEIVRQMTTERLGELIEEMDGDDAADMISVVDEIDQAKAGQVLEVLPVKERQEITNLLQYDEDSAGGIMDPNVVAVEQDQTVEQAIQSIRTYIEQEELDTFYAVYVVDEYRHLIGMVRVAQLLLSGRNTLIKGLMDPNVVAVDVDVDQEQVAHIAQEYNLVVIPVIDKYLRLVGRITIDDIIDVVHEEYQEDIGHIAGTGSEEVLETSVFKTSRDRLPWLLLGLGGGFLAAIAMSGYEEALSGIPEVAYFIPLIAALGGNIAIQSSSIVVRGLATGEIRTGDLFYRLWKELRVGFLNGGVCSLLLVAIAWLITSDPKMGIVTGMALLVVVAVATIVGSAVPILLKRLNIDPALATGPFITTANDILGIIIYLMISFSVLDIPVA